VLAGSAVPCEWLCISDTDTRPAGANRPAMSLI
jgi:hypothetical protein